MRAKGWDRSHFTARPGCSRMPGLEVLGLGILALGILGSSCAISLHAQTAAPSAGEPSHAAAAATGAQSADRPGSAGQAQEENQGDQSLDPDPLANPVNPPPTPEEPAAAPTVAPGAQSGAARVGPPGAALPAADAGRGAASSARPAAAAFRPPPVPPPIPSADPRRQQINNECADLLQMADALKIAVDKTTQDELSVTVVRDAGQIEQLARKVKDEMRPTMSGTR